MITITNVKPKESILLNESQIKFDSTSDSTFNDKNRFRFKIVEPVKDKNPKVKTKKGKVLYFGCSTEEKRREWMSIL